MTLAPPPPPAPLARTKANDDEDHLRKGAHVSAGSAAIAGSVSGLVARIVTAPLDTLKIRCQLSPVPTSITTMFTSIYKNEGALAFWKGTVPASFMYMIYGSSQFAMYAVANTALSSMCKEYELNLNPGVHSFMVGCFAGTSSTLLSYPFDLLRTTLVSNNERKFNKLIPVVKQIWTEQGNVLGFYKGLNSSLLAVTVQMGLMFQTFETLKTIVRQSAEKDKDNKNTKFFTMSKIDPFVGFISGIVAKTGSFPLDLIRKRLQIADKRGHNGSNANTSLAVVKHILRTQGPRGFFNGLSTALLKSGPTSAVSLWVYEYAVSAMS